MPTADLGDVKLYYEEQGAGDPLLLVMGLVYNVEPVRSKDKAYIDVLSESINNPLRLLLGWSAIIDSALPPISVLVSYWMGGAYLMAIKRYAEFLDLKQIALLHLNKNFERLVL